ncbi:MAG: type I polyketide synthase, partial [Stackebrandtia sp.]
PVLGVGMQETFDEAGLGAQSVALGTLRRGDGGMRRFGSSRTQLWANGVDVDFGADFAGASMVDLPAEAAPSSGSNSPFADLPDLGVDEQRLRLGDMVRGHAAAVRDVAPNGISLDVAFRDAGFDSAMAVELRTTLNDATGLNMPAAVVYSCPTPRDLAERIRRELLGEAAPVAEARPTASDPGEPIAIVGMACRFPGGVRSPEDLWKLVTDGVDAMGEFPTDRGWELDELFDPEGRRPGSTYVDKGAFLYDAGDFDAGFFGISPREALAMDPQQRLTLEVAWEALERAGINPSTLKGSDAGVYIGASHQEYGSSLDRAPEGFEGQMLTGTTDSVLSGRVSYTLGLRGPALTVDTACSASLVSLHLASQGLRQGDCSMALVGGVTVMARPGMFVELGKQRGLAADGRCKAFSAAADGTNWAEGVGMLVVERLSDAQRLGHRVLAVVRGSAINQDGASNGLSAPNGPAQERVIHHALAAAGLSTRDVDAVEAHGTGTKLGDPIEAQAILATYGQGRDGSAPVYLGSLKSNIGHAQTTAGVGGVIKMVMAMRHGLLPRTLHVDEPSPHIDWDCGAVELLTTARPWPEVGRPRRAGVSSFGISGTNAHVIVEHDPVAEQPARAEAGPVVWTLSGRTPRALADQARRLADRVRGDPDLDLAAVARSLATTRAALRVRGAVVGGGRGGLLAGVEALAAGGEPPDSVVCGEAVAHNAGPVFVFPGQGAQWTGMGIELAAAYPVFAQALGECAQALEPHVDWRLCDVLESELDDVVAVQCSLWAVMVSLAKLWQSFGVEPAAVVGHSQGELAAAVISGALSLPDAARVVALRSRLVRERLAGHGGMVALGIPVAEASQRIEAWNGSISIAAVNGPRTTIVSGAVEALDELVASCESDDIDARRIPVDYASHSIQVESIRDELTTAIAGIRPQATRIPFHSTVTGKVEAGTYLDADYWYGNLRETVQLEAVVHDLIGSGHTAYLELSPHPVLRTAINDTAESHGTDATVIESLRRDDGGAERFLTALATAHVNGVGIDWTRTFPNASIIDLPTYPFQHQRYWLSSPGSPHTDAHPLSAVATPLVDTDAALLTATVSSSATGWLADYDVGGRRQLSATAFVELALQAGARLGEPGEFTLRAHLNGRLDLV